MSLWWFQEQSYKLRHEMKDVKEAITKTSAKFFSWIDRIPIVLFSRSIYYHAIADQQTITND